MKVNITPKQFDALHAALLLAFNLDDMKLLLLKHKLRLEDLTGTLKRELAFGELIDEFEKRGLLPDFVTWASEAREVDSDLPGLAQEIRIMTLTSPLHDQRDALITLLDQAKINDDAIYVGYRRFAPAGRENELQVFRPVHAAAVAVYTLADATQREGQYPLIELAIHFQNGVDAAMRAKLEKWVSAAFATLGVSAQVQHAVAKRVETGKEPYHLYLQVIVERLRRPTIQYDVEVRRQEVLVSGEIRPPESLESFALRDIDEVCKTVREFVADLEGERAQVESFTIEMVLDHRDFALAADQIAADKQAPIAFGAECDVLLRSWDRYYGRECEAWQRVWRESWKTHVEEPSARVCDADFFDPLTFRAQLLAAKASCLLLAFIPPAAHYDDAGLISTMLAGGAPIAVWARHDMHEELLPAFTEFLRHMETCPADWKEPVRKSRLAAAGTRDRHFGRHLCFLFDDGNRPVISEGFDQ